MSKRHEAEQLPLRGVEDVLRLTPTVVLRGEVLSLWRAYQDAAKDLQPSDGQVIVALLAKGLRAWDADRQKRLL